MSEDECQYVVPKMTHDNAVKKIKSHGDALSSLCLLRSNFNAINCSRIAAAIIFVTRRCLGFPNSVVWPDRLVALTTYTFENVIIVVRMIDKAAEKVASGEYLNTSDSTDEECVSNNGEEGDTQDSQSMISVACS
jgi:hypothetical protein